MNNGHRLGSTSSGNSFSLQQENVLIQSSSFGSYNSSNSSGGGFGMSNTNPIHFAAKQGPDFGSSSFTGLMTRTPISVNCKMVKQDGQNKMAVPNRLSLERIKSMNESLEELRWKDYQAGRKGPSTLVEANMGGVSVSGAIASTCPPSGLFRLSAANIGFNQKNFFSGSNTITNKGVQATNTNFTNFGLGSVLGSQTSASMTGTPIKFNPTVTMHDGLISVQHLFHFQSISAMKEYENKSLEELRWEDYQAEKQGSITLSSTAITTSKTGLCGLGFAPGIFLGQQQQTSTIKLSNQVHGESCENSFRKSSMSKLLQPIVLNLVQQVPGISRVKAMTLLQQFSSIHQLSNASVQELEPVVGHSAALYIWGFLHSQFN